MNKQLIWAGVVIAVLLGGGVLLLAAPQVYQPGTLTVPRSTLAEQAPPRSVTPTSPTVTTPMAATAGASHTIGQVSLDPPAVVSGSLHPVTVTATITDPAVITNSVTLVRVPPNGSPVVIGSLNDTGTGGDITPNNGTYTISWVPMPALAPGVVVLRVTAAFKGVLLRSQSADISLAVASPTSTVAWTTISDSQHLFSLKVPTQWQLVMSEDFSPDQFALKTVYFSFPDGTSAFYITAYTVTAWHAAAADDPPISDLLAQNQQYVFTVTEGQDIEPPGYTDAQVRALLPQVFATFVVN